MIELFVHFIFIFISSIFLVYAIWYKGKRRLIFGILFLVVFGFYFSSIIKSHYENSLIEAEYVGKYDLKNYNSRRSCVLELFLDNSYKIYDGIKEYETGNWEYDEDGDHSFIKFTNGGELGLNQYEFEK
ncbi:hypothetical protein [Flavobacterium tiangeerense]|uniref:hypothetical protein n=1 Tax=Flavobacterium tiangeerense TaxID=459471 RepID=UPI0011A87B20|nr:hypothetical protein [Flavobacterium tiangeerense]